MQRGEGNGQKFYHALKTHSEFDVEDNIEEVESEEGSSDLVSKLNSTLPASVLTLALIYSICCDKENNAEIRDTFFRTVCDQLCEMKYLNSSIVAVYRQLAIPAHFDLLSYFLKTVHRQVRSSFHDMALPSIPRPLPLGPTVTRNFSFSKTQYEESFEELSIIGSGGSGVVCKAFHKVDEAIYAVKKIFFKFKNDEEFQKIVREARSFAALRHRNIVNYNSAWLEYGKNSGEQRNGFSGESSESETAERSSDESRSSPHIKIDEQSLKKSRSSSTFFRGMFGSRNFSSTLMTQEEQEEDDDDLEIVFSAGASDKIKCETIKKETNNVNCVEGDNFDSQGTSTDFQDCQKLLPAKNCLNHLTIPATLYIQMEYCECDLDSWLNGKLGSGPKLDASTTIACPLDSVNIFRQILCGVEYIHSSSIIHRDLKPKNIFISEAKKIVKIGDFGLACLVEQTEDAACCSFLGSVSAVHGTPPYTAPEQKGKNYDFKVDIYSLGIILFEMYHYGFTRSEFYQNVSDFLSGKFKMRGPDEVINLVRQLVKENPDERPTASDILKNPLFKKKSLKKNLEEINKKLMAFSNSMKKAEDIIPILRMQQETSQELLKRNKELVKLNETKDKEIERLQKQIEEMNSKSSFSFSVRES